MNTLQAVDRCITEIKDDAQLITLCGGRVYRVSPPQGAIYPLIRHNLYGRANDRNHLGPFRSWTKGQKLVKAVTTGDGFDTAEQIMTRVDELLHLKKGTYDGFRVMPLYRVAILEPYTEVVSGVRFNHYAFLYEFFSYAL
jgi:hypothetical protein